ncbi:MFS transporter [Burkholderia lata]|uniref:MFS transporter n=1 Tax=Burkholderia lata (strain ATCC 17760 / DSM 23089 / LMG 22485 / NCIMB 9086 / R18194 / 383) TaxID=482957 RepID=A0A6P2NXG9_BURL3|nr:MFS transporter [Burkholderia lata]VWB99285.1 MFS transporter [Burkholderia lata]
MNVVNLQDEARQESARFVVVMLLLGMLGPTVFLGLPAIVGQVERHWGFGEAALGLSSFIEVLGESTGTLLVAFVLGRQPVRWVLAGAVTLAAGANLGTLATHGLVAYSALQFIAGVGSGGLNGIALRYLSYSRAPERNLGIMLMGQVTWSMVLLAYIFPMLSDTWGAHGVFGFVACVLGMFVLATPLFRRGETMAAPTPAGVAGRIDRKGAMLVLCAQLALYGGVGVVWTFLEKIGTAAGLSGKSVSLVLGAANIASLVICAAMPKLGAGTGLRRWALVNLGGCAVAAVLLALPASAVTFTLGAIVFIGCWTGGALLIYATIPQYDLVGKSAALSPGCVALGYGVGSVAGGSLIERAGTQSALTAAIVLCAVAFLCYRRLRPAVFGMERALAVVSE